MDRISFLTISGMAAATYLTRFLGFWLAGRMDMTPRFRHALKSVPIAILVSIAAPQIISGTLAEALASVVVVIAAATGRGLLVCMAAGIIAVNLFRYFL